MKDEIKEILDNFKIYEGRYRKFNETQFIIFYRDIHLLLDYITNLQQENKQLKEEKKEVIEYIHKMQRNFKQEEHTGSAYDDDIFYEDILKILGDKE